MKSIGARDPERGPADYDEDQDERQLLWSLVREMRKSGGGYHEAPKDSGLKAVVIGCTITLLSTMIIAAFMLTNEFAAFKAQVNEWQKSTDRRLEMLERRP